MRWVTRYSSSFRRTIRCLPPPGAGRDPERAVTAGAETAVSVAASPEVPETSLPSGGRLRQIVAYGKEVYGLGRLLGGVVDERRKPTVTTKDVSSAVFFAGLLRTRSFNALEPKLAEKTFLRLLGKGSTVESISSVDTVSRTLRVMDLESVWAVCRGFVEKAERNKVFREGSYGALRYVALDGWEPISSWGRHCSKCLVRYVKVKNNQGDVVETEQYYHRYAVAMLIDRRFDLVLDFEPLLTNDLRQPVAKKRKNRTELVRPDEDEGELTAAKRLLRRVKETYNWIDVVIGDALYANGPFLTLVQELRMGAVVIAKREADEPLKEALSLWGRQPPHEVVLNKEKKEQIELWDCRDIKTLDTYKDGIRVVRASILNPENPSESRRTWCMLVTGQASRLSSESVLKVARSRWHIELTGFRQWTTLWKFAHVFVHDARGIQNLYWLFFAAYNLLTLFLYRQLRSHGRDRGGDVTKTISRVVDEMLDDLARIDTPLLDTG